MLDRYITTAETTEALDWAPLRTLHLSNFDSQDPQKREAFQHDFSSAVREDGFLYLVDHGLTQQQIDRQFAICQKTLLSGRMTPKEKKRLEMDPTSGRFSGYKPPGFKICADGFPDTWEEFNAWSDAFQDPEQGLPEALREDLEEVKSYVEHCRTVIVPKLLVLFSRMLELPDDYMDKYLMDHQDRFLGNGYYKQMVYHPKPKKQLEQGAGVTFTGHKDFELITLLLSQPIAGLQVFCSDKSWRWVRPLRGAIIVNLGETLEFVSGGHLPATRHRVVDPPVDQRGIPRLSVVLFNASRSDLSLEPLRESPLIRREGIKPVFQRLSDNVSFPTADEYRQLRSQSVFDVGSQEIVEIDGVRYRRERCGDFAVLEPI